MPYTIIKRGTGYFVVKASGGGLILKKFSKHPLTKIMAQKQLKAIIFSELVN